jgi:hypothetical protein
VKIRYNPLEASGDDTSPERASRVEGLFSPFFAVSVFPTHSLFSLFARKRIFASPSFPCTYPLFQNEYSRKSQQSKGLIHAFAKHPGGVPSLHPRVATSLLRRRTRPKHCNPSRIKHLSTLAAHNGGGGTARPTASAHTHESAQLQSFHVFTSQFSVDPGVGYAVRLLSPGVGWRTPELCRSLHV